MSARNRRTPTPSDISPEEQNVINFAKHMLKGRIFSGRYEEKRLIHELDTYRDLIIIDREETRFIDDLNVVLTRLQNYYRSQWIGITTPSTIGTPAHYCLWVQLEEEVFDTYKFKVKTVKFSKNEITLQLKRVIEINQSDSNESFDFTEENIKQYFKDNFKQGLIEFLRVMTFHNIKESIVFLFVLLFTLLTGCISLLQHFMNFSLKFMNEMSKMIHAMTPIAIAIIQFFEKIVMGLYMTIAVLIRGSSVPPPNSQAMQRAQKVRYYQQRNNRIEYYPQQKQVKQGGVVIEEVYD